MTLALIMLLASSAIADPGRSAAAGLSIAPHARAAGLGEAYTAAVDDASALYWNPAALIRTKRHSVVLMHGTLLDGGHSDYVSYAGRAHSKVALGASMQYYSAGKITETDIAGAELGGFTPSDLGLAAGVSVDLGHASVGASGKYIRSRIVSSAETMAVDLGLISKPLWRERVRLAAVISNIGGKLRFDRESEKLEKQFRLGAAVSNPFGLVSLDVAKPEDNAVYAALGYERPLKINDDWKITPRAGFNTRTIGDVNGFTGFSFGFGLTRKVITMDYALLPLGHLGLTQRLSLTLGF